MRTLIHTNTIPADGFGTAAYRYTLSKADFGIHPYVTHVQNMEYGEDRGKSWGHYFKTRAEALTDLLIRVAEDENSPRLSLKYIDI